MKTLFYIVSITLFAILCVVYAHKVSEYNVLEVVSASEFVIDFNHNKTQDENEFVKFDIETAFDEKDSLTKEESIIFKELAKNFAKDFFFNKKVRLVNNEIYTGKLSYQNAFKNSGFNFNDNKESYDEVIKYIRSNSFYVLNKHNLRYHRINCPSAFRVEKYFLLNSVDLPSKAKPCKFCVPEAKISKSISKPKVDFVQGDVKVYFSDYTTKLKPSFNCESDICKELLYRINSAERSIDMAIYGYTKVPEIDDAIKRAINRGVKIRLVYDVDAKNETNYLDSKRLAQLVKHATSDYDVEGGYKKYSNTFMHNKFYIFDDQYVITGSANLSPNDMSGFNSNVMLMISSPVVAGIYKKEFEKMFAGQFHNLKTKTQNNTNIELNGSKLSIYFSPQDKITKNHIIPILKTSQKYIYVPAFLITDKWMADELIAAKTRGVDVRIILDASNARSPHSQINYLRENKVPVKVEDYAGKLHSKSILIDDKISVIGSMNFSKSGQNINDENVVVIFNKDLTMLYKHHFNYLWSRIEDRWLHFIPRAEGLDSKGSCNDGLDNNYDGFADSEDVACKDFS